MAVQLYKRRKAKIGMILGNFKSMLPVIGQVAGSLGTSQSNENIKGINEAASSVAGLAGPVGMAIGALNNVTGALTTREIGKNRFGQSITNDGISIGGAVNALSRLLKGGRSNQDIVNEGSEYRIQQANLDAQKKLNQAAALEFERDKLRPVSFGLKKGGLLFKKGGILPCGCNKEKDGFDTDWFYEVPDKWMSVIYHRIGLPINTKYNNDIKTIIKEAVPQNSTLAEFLMELSPSWKEFILHKYKNGGTIQIKPENRGKFTEWCKQKGFNGVTKECIKQGKSSSSAITRKRATFADNFAK